MNSQLNPIAIRLYVAGYHPMQFAKLIKLKFRLKETLIFTSKVIIACMAMGYIPVYLKCISVHSFLSSEVSKW